MLVWLASYPRSGNTLLRQVLKACFDLPSCEGLEPVPTNFREPDGIRDEFYGSYFVEGDPDKFYQHALDTTDVVFIKSHQLPRDNEKAIYVVRDGRLALKSFVKFQENHHSNASTFESLLVGDHAYGDWTSHYRAWSERPRGETLVLRFEELVEADAALLEQLACFIGRTGPLRPWVNPQAELRAHDPAFFGSGNRVWKPDEFWTESRLRAFDTLHGSLLVELGYANGAEVEATAYPAGSDQERLLRLTHRLAANSANLQRVCDERHAALVRTQRVCDELAAEIARLAEACQERARLITSLHQVCAESQTALNAARQRLQATEQQLQAAQKRAGELEAQSKASERGMSRLPVFGFLRRMVRG
ncbi:MAG: sulfotransferase domain-containing protein [Planctomycetia bacterium]|nr:sulfotransferase domain-containing protein [Planctomycetia bacterium]